MIVAIEAIVAIVAMVAIETIETVGAAGGPLESLLDILEQVVDILQSHAKAYRSVEDIHFGESLRPEVAEDGGVGVDGKRTVVEEVGGTVDELKVVQEAEARLLVLEVKANHSSGSLSELLLCQLVIRIVLQSYIISVH